MAQKFITIAIAVCVLVAFVQSAPQFNNRGAQTFRGTNQLARAPAQQFNNFQQPQPQPQPLPQARSADPERQSRFLVVDEKFNKDPSGEYAFEQKFASGETYNEQGSLKSVVNAEDGQERNVIVTRGSYTIIDKDGSTVLVNYTADENGFHPEIVTGSPVGK